ncbi:D-alanyl-D-alanine dipeptidase [Mycobacterium simiae]|uniref:D-alanyl-D-alanine dipeptidase n=1 Tax=Mycobacterium simiae TaxID=1784 RepID=A0A5B1BWB4_MYCSI|nr:M15 family metallopeptidase [Mycobacterium simiae]KAA1251524.1 D-alanyl-D-alanine dipeptidase [Mycobacterium simiae]
MGVLGRLGAGILVLACAASCRFSAAPSASSRSAVRAIATTTSTSVPGVPPVSAAAAAAGLVDVRSVVPDAIVELRYATANNFTHTQLYPAGARCLVHQSMAQGLAAAASALRPQGQLLVFWDCYRPHDVQIKLFQVVPNPAWVARPGPYAHSHEAGRSVDVTFASAQAQCPPERQLNGPCLADMGTDFDDFSSRAEAFATQGVSDVAQVNRKRLRDVMNYGGLSVYSGEWWHFDGPGAGVDRAILNAPID